MTNLLETEARSFSDASAEPHHRGWPGIDYREVSELVSQIPDNSWTLPDISFARYNVQRMVDFLTRAQDGFGIAHLAARGIRTGELRALEAYLYFSKVMNPTATFEEKGSILCSVLNGMQALADGGGQRVTDEDISKARTFLGSYVSFEQRCEEQSTVLGNSNG